MFIIKYRKYFYIFSSVLITASIASILLFGFRLGIDFTGGSILEAEYKNGRPDISLIKEGIKEGGFDNAIVQPTGDNGVLVRLRELSEEEHQTLLDTPIFEGSEQLRFDSIGPIIGNELKKNSLTAIILVLVMILAFVTWSFRKVSKPVSSWKYGVVAIVALTHDVLVPIGFFVVLGKFINVEADTLFVTALLTILGFSVHDTIVVFDRIRENIRRFGSSLQFEEVVGKSLSEVIGRSLATSFALFIVLLLLYIFGESSTSYFILTLLVGVIAGTYSSVFLASPLIVSWDNLSRARKRS